MIVVEAQQPAPAPAIDSVAAAAVADSVLASAMKTHGAPGAVIAVVRDGRIVVLRGAGYANVERRIPVSAESTTFALASVSKTVVATTILALVDQGRLRLDTDVREYQTGVPLDTPPGNPITLDRLLTHSAGFDERNIGYAARTAGDIQPLGDYLRRRMPGLARPPGTATSYSNHGYALAALIAERVTGEPFPAIASRAVFEPLGMTSTTIDQRVPPSIAPRLAAGHACTKDACRPLPSFYRHPYPAGALVSSAPDMGRFLLAHLAAPGAPALMRPATLAMMHEQHFANGPSLDGMAYGFFEQRLAGHRTLAHSGQNPGGMAVVAFVPDAGVGFFIASNGGSSRFGGVVLHALADRFLTPLAAASPSSASPQAWNPPTAAIAGAYRLTRYSRHTVENLPGLFNGQFHVGVRGDTLLMDLGRDTERFVRRAPLVFQEVGGDRRVGVRVDARGRVSHVFGPQSFYGAEFPAAYERLAWYDAPHFLNELISYVFALPLLLACIAWPIGAGAVALWRRRRARIAGTTRTRPDRHGIALALAIMSSLLLFVHALRVIAATNHGFEGDGSLFFGVTPALRLLATIPFALVAIGAAMVWAAARSWRERWWDGWRRVLYSALAANLVLAVAILVHWSYLPARF